mmetsp:Transcript_51256/g.92125  ORF Transcript_51256/g.92125 Transcript_51256/m.92125 type:complete len:155 (+) Transcript_51256:38-502(+)
MKRPGMEGTAGKVKAKAKALRKPAKKGAKGQLEQRMKRGRATRMDGEYPRTLYTVAVGKQLSCGEESIDPRSEVPWHSHESSEEVLRCTAGAGKIYVGKRVQDFLPGVSVLVPMKTRHRIVNLSAKAELWLSWTLSPPLQVAQFQAGKNRVPGR